MAKGFQCRCKRDDGFLNKIQIQLQLTASYSLTFQPKPFPGSTVVKSRRKRTARGGPISRNALTCFWWFLIKSLFQELRMLSMKEAVGWTLVAGVMVVMFINGIFMLASPRAWFRLPSWIRAQGTLTEDKYGSGWGGIMVRLTGAVVLATIAWVLFDSFIRG